MLKTQADNQEKNVATDKKYILRKIYFKFQIVNHHHLQKNFLQRNITLMVHW